jgi:hypothetical protein
MRNVAALVGSLTAVLFSTKASMADDFKILPGVACETGGNLTGGELQSFTDPAFSARVVFGLGSIYNPSATGGFSTVNAYCPLVRDTIYSDTAGLLSATVYFVDDSPSAEASCTLYSVSMPGSGVPSVLVSETRVSGVSFSGGAIAKNYLTVTSSQSLTGYYFMYCALGTRTGVYSYRWKETTTTDE